MKKTEKTRQWRYWAALTALALIFTAQSWAQGSSAIQATLVVKVSDRDQAADAVVAQAKALQGYYIEKSQKEVIVKVPAEYVGALMDKAVQLGELVDRRFYRQDLADELLTKQAALRAKLDVQKQYEALLAQADVDAVLYVEKELIQLVAQIETLKGAIRYLEHRICFAQVGVAFEYRDRPAPVADGRSSFKWLNTMNLTDLLRAF